MESATAPERAVDAYGEPTGVVGRHGVVGVRDVVGPGVEIEVLVDGLVPRSLGVSLSDTVGRWSASQKVRVPSLSSLGSGDGLSQSIDHDPAVVLTMVERLADPVAPLLEVIKEDVPILEREREDSNAIFAHRGRHEVVCAADGSERRSEKAD